MSPLRAISLMTCLVLLAAPALSADPPEAPSSARPLEKQRERLLEQLRQRGLVVPGASSAAPAPSLSAAPAGSVSPPAANPQGVADELGRKWRALAATRLERRDRHRAALVRQLGQRLSDPQVKEELRLHATRVAELSRIQFLTDITRSGAAREQLTSRVAKLLAREAERHRKRLAALTAASPPPSGATSVAPPAARPSSGAAR